jgi:hypothetical protein
MTTIAKAIAFAKECLKWHDVSHKNGIVSDSATHAFFDPDSLPDCQSRLGEFLGKRFFIQINRGTTSLFQWSVIVGLQNRMNRPPIFDHGRGESDDMFDAVFDACVAAVRLYPNA